MRRWMLYAGVLGLIALLNVTGFTGTDVGKLQPVQAVFVEKEGNRIAIQTDTGDAGEGESLKSALTDMLNSTAGKLFLETADYLVLRPGCETLIPELAEHLRPSCRVCTATGMSDAETTAAYLAVHEPETTLRIWLGGERRIPVLKEREGRLELVP